MAVTAWALGLSIVIAMFLASREIDATMAHVWRAVFQSAARRPSGSAVP